MSALPPKADIAEGNWNVRFMPKADIGELMAPAHKLNQAEYSIKRGELLGPNGTRVQNWCRVSLTLKDSIGRRDLPLWPDRSRDPVQYHSV